MSSILETIRLSMPWKTYDPFLFCVHHRDFYPESAGSGSEYSDLGVKQSLLSQRDLGSDFSGKDGFSMYHGEVVPGFPGHPHYGFETVTVVREGLIDHFDSHGYTARYGGGDAQWLTAGAGIQHSEMFPLVHSDKPNTLDLFQLWLNLPAAKKKSKPFFSMAWSEEQPNESFGDVKGKQTHVRLIGGNFAGLKSVPPPPDSYASNPKSEVIIAILKLDPHTSFTLPKASSSEINRAIYFYEGTKLTVASQLFTDKGFGMKLKADDDVVISTQETPCEVLLLQGRPINEPVIQHGPFVTNSREELFEVNMNFRKTHFGGWKWGRYDPVHPRTETRFYKIEGKRVEPPTKSDSSAKADEGSEECNMKKTKLYRVLDSSSKA